MLELAQCAIPVMVRNNHLHVPNVVLSGVILGHWLGSFVVPLCIVDVSLSQYVGK